MSYYLKASQTAPKSRKLELLGITAFLVSIATPATAQEPIGNILHDQGYHKTFEYDFGDSTKPEDIDGTTIWERNLWYMGNVDPRYLVRHSDYYSFVTPTTAIKQRTSTTLTTWSKSKKAPLVKFHYGYLEATMRFKSSPTNWPAFWALSTNLPLLPKGPDDQAIGRWCEIDVYEGSTAGIYAANVHDWVGRHSDEMKVQHTALPASADLSSWNTYGALWTKDTIKFYFNGTMINEAPTPKPCQDNDVFLILSSQTRDSSAGPAQLDVKRVRVFTN